MLAPKLGGLFRASVSLFIKWGCQRYTAHRAVARALGSDWPSVSHGRAGAVNTDALVPTQGPGPRGGDSCRQGGSSSKGPESLKAGKFKYPEIGGADVQNRCNRALLDIHSPGFPGRLRSRGGRRREGGREGISRGQEGPQVHHCQPL